jgi:two-component system NarL family response regulator
MPASDLRIENDKSGNRRVHSPDIQNHVTMPERRIRLIPPSPGYTGKAPYADNRPRYDFDAAPQAPTRLQAVPHENIPLRILIADDHPVVREGLAALINLRNDMTIISQVSNGRDAFEQFVANRPDVAIIDLRMPILSGIETVAAICEADPTAHLVILTIFHNEEDIYQALQAGAQGYLSKTAPIEELVECIHSVFAGRTWVPPGVGAQLAKRVATRELTRREGEVLRAMAGGKSNKEIGVALDISEGTVKVHMTHILEKLKASGRTEAIGVAVKRGLVCLDTTVAA